MKTKYCILMMLFACGSFRAFSQDTENHKKEAKLKDLSKESLKVLDVSLQTAMPSNTNQLVIPLVDLRFEGTKGSYYYNPQWLPADLYATNGSLLRKGVPVKYDAVNRELVMKTPLGDSVAVYPASFKIYDLRNKQTYYFSKFSTKSNNLPNTYLQVLYEGKQVLLKNVSKEIVRANYQGAYSQNRPYDEFVENSEYFLLKQDGGVSKIKPKKNIVLASLKDKKNEVEDYIKKNSLDVSNELTLVDVLAYYENLK